MRQSYQKISAGKRCLFMSKMLLYALSVLLVFSTLTGCASVMSPVSGYLITSVQGPITATGESSYVKKGHGSCISVLGLFAVGDASIDTIIRRAKITKVHHVDYASTSFLFLFSKYTVWVFGE